MAAASASSFALRASDFKPPAPPSPAPDFVLGSIPGPPFKSVFGFNSAMASVSYPRIRYRLTKLLSSRRLPGQVYSRQAFIIVGESGRGARAYRSDIRDMKCL